MQKILIIRLEARDYNFLYSDGNDYVFMDQETFEQINLNETQLAGVKDFLIENTKTTIAFNNEEPIEVRIPQNTGQVIFE